jgi:Na+-driven multidrug efflux pump
VSSDAPEAPPSRTPELIDESNLLGSVLRLAWPVVVQQVSFSMVQLVDTALVGHLGEDALAGVRLAGQLFWFSQTGLVAVGVGATATGARSIGAGESHRASTYVQTGFVLALAWGILMRPS